MKSTEVLIKWTGSKRNQSLRLLSYFPSQINTYYEPFVGSAALTYALLASSIPVQRICCSDLCQPLIAIFQLVKTNPYQLLQTYTKHWQQLQTGGKEYYCQVRQQFNADQDPGKFLFLLRTCRNGLARFNQKGHFNSGFHFGRPGISPDKLEMILKHWYLKLQSVEFSVRDYRSVQTAPGDFMYLDPPYISTTALYMGMIDYNELWAWLGRQRGGYLLSLKGFRDETDQRSLVPLHLFDQHLLSEQTHSKFSQLLKTQVEVSDSLYLKTGNL